MIRQNCDVMTNPRTCVCGSEIAMAADRHTRRPQKGFSGREDKRVGREKDAMSGFI